MEQIVTITAALVGSGLLSTVLTLLVHRSRHDRHVDHMDTWRSEDDLLQDLEKRAGFETSIDVNQPRNTALAVAAKARINASIAARLIQPDNLRFGALTFGGLAATLSGLFFVVGGTVYAETDQLPIILAYLFVVVGIALITMGAAMVLKGLKADTYQNLMRSEVQRVLDGDTDNSKPKNRKHAQRHGWHPGGQLKFSWYHRSALRPGTIQAFTHFMENVQIYNSSSSRSGSPHSSNT